MLAETAGAVQIRGMSVFRASFLALVILLGACRKDKKVDQAPKNPAAGQVLPPTLSRYAATGWPDDAGPVVVLPAGPPQEVQLVMPELSDQTLSDTSSFDLDSLPKGSVSLFSRTRRSTVATIEIGGGEDAPRGCKTWPSARLDSYHGEAWSFGLARGVADDLPLHTWGPPLATDSAGAARDVIEIASKARSDSSFSGIPFTLRYLYRIELNNVRAIVADAVRRINTEANIREEHVFVIAEREKDSQRYVPGYRETQMGREEEVRVPEIVGAVFLGENRRPAIFVSLEYSDGARLMLMERVGPSRWERRWRGAYSGC